MSILRVLKLKYTELFIMPIDNAFTIYNLYLNKVNTSNYVFLVLVELMTLHRLG